MYSPKLLLDPDKAQKDIPNVELNEIYARKV